MQLYTSILKLKWLDGFGASEKSLEGTNNCKTYSWDGHRNTRSGHKRFPSGR